MNSKSLVIYGCLAGGAIALGALALLIISQSGREKEQTEPPVNRKKKVVKRKPPTPTPKEEVEDAVVVEEKTTKVDEVIDQSLPEDGVEKLDLANDDFPLRLGSKGKRVERLKVWLLRKFGWTGEITDEFDEQTLGVLRRFMKKDELDEETYYKLKMGKPVYKQLLMK